MSIATKLAELTQIRTDIRTALAGKGISASTHDFADFPQDIDDIQTGGGRLPAEYQEVYYLKTDGNQYIDTGFQPNNNTRVKMSCAIVRQQNVDYNTFGARISSGNSMFCVNINSWSGTYFKSHFANTTASNKSYTGDYIEIDKNKNVTTVNGSVDTIANSTFSTNYNLYLGAWNTSGTATTGKGLYIICATIWDNDTLVRHFIPCYRIADSVIGMYDTVNDVFYTNAGTGTFTKGADV